ncbi:hypothetical protein GQ53DRAFT_838924 [Thozetella sp. PMI_491]|nr:hypothetical protein GQ53DRAFT_838924 [Thozetella sp. PMI_491]
MVYRGTPSKACLRCRKRKLKCDLHPEGCGQCRRAEVTCLGYRDPDRLRVKNETEKARSNVLERYSRRAWDAAAKDGPAGLNLGCEARSRAAFFSFYVFGLTRSHDALPALYDQAAPGSPLAESVDAVSLALMANHYAQSSLSTTASEKYLVALRLVNQALRNSREAVLDSTLQSVLLLDLYEKIVNRDRVTGFSWMVHVNGALSLVKARGDDNLSTHTARRLATRLVITLSISCGAASLRVPDELMDLCRKLDPYAKRNDAKWLATEPILRFLNLKADISQGRFSTNADIIASLMEMESEFITTSRRLAPLWRPTRVCAQGHSPLVYGGFYHIYPDHFTTQGANVFRVMRLFLHGMLQHHTTRDPERLKKLDEVNESLAITEQIAEEICAAVPQCILPEARAGNAIPFTPLQMLQCYTMVPPLYAAGQFSQNTKLRMWAIKTLNYIAEAGGMQMVKQVADLLETDRNIPYWGVYTMLGSYAFAP